MAEKILYRVFAGIMGLVIVSLIFAVAYSTNSNTPKTSGETTSTPLLNQTESPQSTTTVPAPLPTPTPININPTILYSSYINNPVAADQIYKGKTVEMIGNISTIERDDSTGKAYVVLCDYASYEITGVYTGNIRCFFSDEMEIVPLQPGDFITVEGICTGTFNRMVNIEEVSLKSDIKLTHHWAGRGNLKTEQFTVDTQPWAIAWVNDPISAAAGAGILKVTVYNAASPNIPLQWAADTLVKGSDISYINDTGSFYLSVNATNTYWSVGVYKQAESLSP